MYWFVFLAALVLAGPAAAQPSAFGSMTGQVRDVSGRPVPDISVVAVNVARQQTWTAVSDAAGRYRVGPLPPGTYQVTAQASGFVPPVREVTVAAGVGLDVPLTLVPAGLEERITVRAEPAIVELRRTEISERITPLEIDALPLNGRNYLDLALLVPGASRTIQRNTERFAETSAVPGTGISVSGQRNLNNTFLVDGLSANDDAAGLAGTFYSQEVVREFQVVTSGGAAEFGRASAGAVNIVTQSGTNTWRGRAYAYARDERFDARNPFATARDPLSQWQYGGSFGGPVRKERTFVFSNIERTRQHRTSYVTIPPGAIAAVNNVLDATRYRGPRASTGAFKTGYESTNVFARVDHRLGAGHLMAARYSLYDISSDNARNVGGLNTTSRGTALTNRDQTVAVSSLNTWNSGISQDLRAQATRSRLAAPANDRVGPAINISGVANLGAASSSPEGRDTGIVEVADTITVQRGSHLFKIGGDILFNDLRIGFPGPRPGIYAFGSLANFQSGRYTTFQQAFGEADQSQSNLNAAVFVQDEWRAHDAVALTAGVRYDVQDLESPMATDRNNVSPRAGLAWAPGDRRTVVRGSAGLYFDRIPLRAVSNALHRDGVRYRVAVLSFGQPGAPVFPETLPRYPDGVLTAITTMDRGIDAGMSRQASAQVERQVSERMSVTAAYSLLRGSGIIMARNVNAPTLSAATAARLGVPNLGRPNAAFGNITRYESIGRSQYDGLTLSAHGRPRWGDLRASYTLSRALDDAGNAFFSAPQDNEDPRADWGPSDNDQRHRVAVSGVIESTPASGATHPLLRDWSVSWVYAYGSAPPFNVQTGDDRNNDTTSNDRPAGVPRNSARGFDMATLDLRLARRWIVRRATLETSVDAFNVTNRANLMIPNNVIGTGPTPPLTFGRATAAGDPRQVQFGVRLGF